MSMVINTNVQATRTHGVYNRNTSAMNDAMTRVATAQKINSAKDGASIYAISERMRSQIRANDQANQNTQNDSALLKTAQGGIANTISILNTLKERAINAANDSNLNMNRSDIATEVKELVAQIDDNANKVKFNGRNLLNGAVDNTVGTLNGSGAVGAINTGASKVDNPKTSATHAVYGLTGLQQTDGSAASAVTAGTAKLVNLSDGTNPANGIFHSGDKITVSWKENGALVKKEVTIDANKTLAGLATDLSSTKLKFSFEATGTAKLTSLDSGDDAKVLAASDFAELTVTNAGGAGLYAIGNKDVRITDLAISVTSKSPTGEDITNVDAQNVLSKIKGVQQSFGPTTEGSHTVFSGTLALADPDKGVDASSGNATKFNALTDAGGDAVFEEAISIGVTINGDAEFKFGAESTIDDLNNELAKRGYDIRAYLLDKGDNITYEGTNVTRGSGENEMAVKAAAPSLYFVAADGKDISSISIRGLKVGETASTATNDSGLSTITSLQTRGSGASSSSDTSAPLTFFVGGEPNFGIDVTISKMTADSLLGTNADTFAKNFLTKEGAKSALTTIDEAINKALNEQTHLGAVEARLGYTSDNLTTMNENLEATDSVMRDADLAKEMTNYMKFSVLSQAAQYMLAQSGQNAFSVLNLLQQ